MLSKCMTYLLPSAISKETSNATSKAEAYLGTWGLLAIIFQNAYEALNLGQTSVVNAILLATIAGVVFIVVGELFLMWAPTRAVGIILQARVMNAPLNWRTHTLRSFLEVGSWLAVIWETNHIYNDIWFSVKCGTLSSILVIVLGDMLLALLRGDTQPSTDGVARDILPIVCLLGSAVLWGLDVIYRNNDHILTTFVLATGACVTFVLAGEAFLMCPYTNTVGQILRSRILDFGVISTNWKQHTVRSLVETGIWLGVIFGTYHFCHNVVTAVRFGTVSGIIVVLSGEAFSRSVRLPPSLFHKNAITPSRHSLTKSLPLLMLFSYFGFYALSMIYEHHSTLTTASVLATLAGIAFVLAGEVLLLWPPTRDAGLVLQRRVVETFPNWQQHTLRSCVELSSWLATVWGTYLAYHNFVTAVQMGTLAGAIVILSGEHFMHTRNIRIRLNVGESAQSCEKDDYSKVLPIVLLLGWVGSEFLLFLYGSQHDVSKAFFLTFIAGIAFIMAGEVLMSWEPTKRAGIIIQTRVLNAPYNWRTRTLRSFTEVSLWLASMWGMFFVYGCSMAIAVKSVTLVFVAIILLVESFEQSSPRASTRRSAKIAANKPSTPLVTTMEEVAKHNKEDDAWLVIDGSVYDVTSWWRHHPGGSIILTMCGGDASDQFEAFHLPRVAHRLAALRIGTVTNPPKPSAITEDYRKLRAFLWKNGWFAVNNRFFVAKHLVVLLFGVLTFALVLQGPFAILRCGVAAVCCGMFWQQSAFLAHDALHNGVRRPRAGGGFNLLGWIHGSCIFGISSKMWLDDHSVHHAITLRPNSDPQFKYLPLWLQSTKELEAQPVTRLMKALVSIQHWTILPLPVIVGRINLYIISIVVAIANGFISDLLGMALYWCWYIFLLSALPDSFERTIFFWISHLTIGILHVQLLVNHLATNVYTKEEETELQFCAFQINTTRNVNSYWYNHWFHGGLQFQLEHHLFPQLPRHNLPLIKPYIEALCHKHGLHYRTTDFVPAIHECVQDFERLSHALINVELG